MQWMVIKLEEKKYKLNIKKVTDKHLVIYQKLRSRLFDISRRNRLLYYKPNLKFLNLTVVSVPVNVPLNEIEKTSICSLNEDLENKIIAQSKIDLSQFIDFENDSYLVSILNKIRLEDNRNINEYGFSQLKIAIVFLNWFNVKDEIKEEIKSPLVLVPIKIIKQKGVVDNYLLQIQSNEAEINPVIRFQLKELYNIQLPETIELDEFKINDLFQFIKDEILKSTEEIKIDIISQPNIEVLQKKAILSYQKINKKNIPNSTEPKAQIDEIVLNPYQWEFDLCHVVLGNFNYKKMSLVSDYNEIIETEKTNNVFDLLFDDLPKTVINADNPNVLFNDLYNVVASDPTQNNAIQKARQNTSYIIQGPPGTGKSQTITNLIADFVANGKKVLFVCEKRAAIDVVFYRLKQENLDELCCLIHDSQADKKEFIHNLKQNYELNLKNNTNLDDIIQQRKDVVQYIQQELKIIEHFNKLMNSNIDSANLKSIEIYNKLIELNDFANDLKNVTFDDVIGYKEWLKFGETIEQLYSKLKSHNNKNYFTEHPISQLNDLLIETAPTPNELKSKLSEIAELSNEIIEYLELTNFDENYKENTNDLKNLLNNIDELKLFLDAKQLDLLNENSANYHSFLQQRNEIITLDNSIENIQQKNKNWTHKFSETDTENALKIAEDFEEAFFRIFYSSYRKMKSSVTNAYDFSQHQIKPKYSQVLQQLQQEYQVIQEQNDSINKAEQQYKIGNIEEAYQQIQDCQNKLHPEIKELLHKDSNENNIKDLFVIKIKFDRLIKLVNQILDARNIDKLSKIEQSAEDILPVITDFNVYLPYLSELINASPKLKELLKTKSYSPKQIQTILAQKSMSDFYVLHKEIQKIEGTVLEYHIERIKKLHQQFLKINSTYVRAKQREQFMELVLKSEMSVTGKSNGEKEEKRSLLEARKILENEFSKSMRYKSIRELATAESGKIIRELKPVWLMSPLSVSDTLPLSSQYFDVVIFDEASQITLEEGIPPIFRASQAIIVGDEMQMPPSNFFGSSKSDVDDLWQEETENESNIPLDADSLLNQAARKLPSVLLGWHYRSRHESLISFSNAAFYENQLLTIPDKTDTQQTVNEIVATSSNDASTNFNYLFDRPISYHYMQNGVYDSRTNECEAKYIAELLYQFYTNKSTESIGIVAFSMQQQSEIENAIEKKAQVDKAFDKWLEDEYKRIEDNQFIGLFIKNLENVQGDERDIIIISTCYGYNKENKMLMNFGPINRKGGEKRLNVIFSRAKKHVCIVSSLKHIDIKNDHNDGANYLKKYLHYAALMSTGNLEHAQSILKTLSIQKIATVESIYYLQQQICEALNEQGYFTKINIGQSHFKCHIGIKKSETDKSYLLGIILDDNAHYNNTDLIEQYLLKPNILKNFGWNILQVYAKDWLENRSKVLKLIINKIDGKTDDEILETENISNTETLLNQRIELATTKHNNLVENFNSPINTNTIRLLLEESNTNKFWQITQNKISLIIEFGKVNTNGQKIIKSFETEDLATKEMKRLIEQKKKKNYKITE